MERSNAGRDGLRSRVRKRQMGKAGLFAVESCTASILVSALSMLSLEPI